MYVWDTQSSKIIEKKLLMLSQALANKVSMHCPIQTRMNALEHQKRGFLYFHDPPSGKDGGAHTSLNHIEWESWKGTT